MEEFCARSLEVEELAAILNHIEHCTDCNDLFRSVLRKRIGDSTRTVNLSDSWLRHEHLEYEQLVAYVDNRLDETEREMLDIHLGGCSSCREDLRSFLDYRKLANTVKNVRYAPIQSHDSPAMPTRLSINRRSGIAAAAAIVFAGALLSVLILRGHLGSPSDSAVSQTATNSSAAVNKSPADNQNTSDRDSSAANNSEANNTNAENLQRRHRSPLEIQLPQGRLRLLQTSLDSAMGKTI